MWHYGSVKQMATLRLIFKNHKQEHSSRFLYVTLRFVNILVNSEDKRIVDLSMPQDLSNFASEGVIIRFYH